MRWRDGRLTEAEGGPEPTRIGWGAFTTAGCDKGKPLLWDSHRLRLQTSARFLGAGEGISVPDETEMSAFLEAAGIRGPARLRVVIRRIAADRWSVDAAAESYGVPGPEAVPERLWVDHWDSAPPLAGHKTLSRLPWDLARERAESAGADDVLLVDTDGHLLESAVANVWVIRDGVARTPPAPARCLPGVMREWLLRHLEDTGICARECDLSLSDIDQADELWLSNAVVGLRRVRSILDRKWESWPFFDRVAAIGVPAPGWPGSA